MPLMLNLQFVQMNLPAVDSFAPSCIEEQQLYNEANNTIQGAPCFIHIIDCVYHAFQEYVSPIHEDQKNCFLSS